MKEHGTSIALGLWSAAMLAYYALTIAGNCGEPERDCGAAIGLGLLAAVMIWTAGAGVLLLVAWAAGRLLTKRPGKA